MTTDGPQFRIVFSGEISGERLLADVVQDLQEWLHIPKEKAESLVQGKRAKLKRTYPRKKADRIVEKANMLGAICSIEPVVSASLSLEDVEQEPNQSDSYEETESSMLVNQYSRSPETNSAEEYVPPQHFPTLDSSAFKDDDEVSPAAIKTRKKLPLGIVLLGGFVLLIIVAVLVLLFSGEGSDDVFSSNPSQVPGKNSGQTQQDIARKTISGPEKITRQRLAALNGSVVEWLINFASSFDPRIVSLSVMASDIGLQPADLQDGWNTNIIIEATSSGFTLRSAGADKKFNTADDLVDQRQLK